MPESRPRSSGSSLKGAHVIGFSMGNPGNRKAFTLVELLVVIAIIGVLMALLLPSMNSARSSARKVVCAANLRQFGLALWSYDNDFNGLPGGRFNVSNCLGTATSNAGNSRKMHQIMREDYKIVQKQTLCPSFQGWSAGTFDNPWDKNNDTAQLTYMWMIGWGSRPASPIGNVQIGNIDTGWLKGTYPSYAAGFRPAMWLKRGISLPPNQHPMMFDVNYVNRPQVDMPNTANHLLPNGLPEGANTLFADGHVEYLMVRIGESWELMNVNHYWSPSFAKPAAASLMTTFDN